MSEQKQFPATKRKIERARKEGQVAKSATFSSSFSIVTIVFAAFIIASQTWVDNKMLLEYYILEGVSDPVRSLGKASHFLFGFLATCLVLGAGAAFAGEALQVGIKITAEALSPRISRIDIANGMKRVFGGVRSAGYYFPKLLVLIVFFICFFAFSAQQVQHALWMPRNSMMLLLARLGFEFVGSAVGVLVLSGFIDLAVQRRRFARDQSMSLDEVRRELKEDEGDPHLKGMRRAMHEYISREELTRRVRSSKVIVVETSKEGN